MVKVLSTKDLAQILEIHGFQNFILDLIKQLKSDFSRWNEFTKMPRPAMHVKDGVIELMPICDYDYFTYKYVNGHPKNPFSNKQTVVATGQVSRVKDGYPIVITEMTALTGLRTAATSALATDLMSRKDSKILSIIGTGAQSEFQVMSHILIRDIKEIRYFDIDNKAMDKFEKNLKNLQNKIKFSRCTSNEEAVNNADIIIVCTACKNHVDVIENKWIKNGVHINGLGGDCPGKTELELSIFLRENVKTVVEYFEQSFIEGEIQRFNLQEAKSLVFAELYEIVLNDKKARTNDNEITIFDSVGFAIEDYSALILAYNLAKKYNIGQDLSMIPDIEDPKDLISILNESLQNDLVKNKVS